MSKKRPKPPANGTPPANGRPEPAGGYVMSLTLENVRCFGPKQTLDLSHPKDKTRPAQWTIILGENGTGKTTLLQSLVGLEEIHDDRVSRAEREHGYARIFAYDHGEYVRLHTHGQHQFGECEGTFKITSLGTSSTSQRTFSLSWLGGTTGTETADCTDELLRFYGYGVGRRLIGKGVYNDTSSDAAGNLYTDQYALRSAEDWLLALDYAASKPSRSQSQQQNRRNQVVGLLTGGVLPGVTGVRFETGIGPYPVARVEFHTPDGWVPLRQLGYGYQTLIAWMLDFVSRMVERYPDSPDPLREPAIVVVDEIDLHLHPKWQRQLIAFLSERFPNTQFIATAHSPLVVQAAEDANIAVLRRNPGDDFVTIVNDVDAIRGWRVDQILTSDLFGLESARDRETERLILRQQELAEKRRRTAKEENELAEVTAKLNGTPVGETAADMAALRQAPHALNSPPG